MENLGSIIVVSDVATMPVHPGSAACIDSYCTLLLEAGYTVQFSYLSWRSRAGFEEEKLLRSQWGDHLAFFRATTLENLWRKFEKRIGLKVNRAHPLDHGCPSRFSRYVRFQCRTIRSKAVIVNYWWLTRCLNLATDVRKLVFTHDIFADRLQRTGDSWMSTTSAIELRALSRADCVLAIQETEAEYFRQRTSLSVLSTFCPLPFLEHESFEREEYSAILRWTQLS